MNPEKLSEHKDLASIDAIEIISALKKYNSQFGMGATLARMIIKEERGDADKNTETHTSASDEQTAEQFLSFEEMQSQSLALLDTIGLEYQPMKSNWVIAGSGENHAGSEIRLNLKDGKKFTSYLKALRQESISESQKNSLKEILEVLTKQFDSYDLNDHNDDRLLEFMGNIFPIIIEYRRLFGDDLELVSKDMSKLETYFSYSRKGCLREYRKIEELHLDKPPTGKGFILRWHDDANPKSLQESWDSVIDTLKMVGENSKAKELYEYALKNAIQALVMAIDEVSAWPDKKRDKNNFLAILDKTMSRLS